MNRRSVGVAAEDNTTDSISKDTKPPNWWYSKTHCHVLYVVRYIGQLPNGLSIDTATTMTSELAVAHISRHDEV